MNQKFSIPTIHVFKLRDGKGMTLIPGVIFHSWQDLFNETKLKKALKLLPAEERYNLFFTTNYSDADTQSGRERWGSFSDLLFFDVDGLHKESTERVISIVSEVVGLDSEKMAVVWSGNGLQLFAQLDGEVWSYDPAFLKKHRHIYKHLCLKIEAKLQENEIDYENMDTSVFSDSRVMRLPCTKNIKIKKGKPLNKKAFIVQGNIEAQKWQWPDIARESFDISNIKVDADYVKKECCFIKHCENSPEHVHEPQGYGLLGILGPMGGQEHYVENLFPRFTSSKSLHRGDIGEKLERSKSFPRTCQGILDVWAGCKQCPHYGKVKSPLQLSGDKFIATEESEFTTISYTEKGTMKKTRHYQDLAKAFYRDYNHKHLTHGSNWWIYIEKYNKFIFMKNANAFGILIMNYFKTNPLGPTEMTHAKHYVTHYYKTVSTYDDDFLKNPQGLLNFKNGVYDFDKDIMLPPCKEQGFTYQYPYDYSLDGAATPIFDKMLTMICGNDDKMAILLKEYVGYIISFYPLQYNVFLLAIGEGENGKSTFLRLIEELVGIDLISAVTPAEILKDISASSDLAEKTCVLMDEAPKNTFRNPELIKKLSGATVMRGRPLYQTGFNFRSRAKAIVGFNSFPEIPDTGHAMRRRILVAPFEQRIKKEDKDPMLFEKIREEYPGIYKKCLDAFRGVVSRGGFTRSGQSDKYMSSLMDCTNAFDEWYADKLENVPNASAKYIDLWKSFSGTLTMTEKSHIGRFKFYRDLTTRFTNDKNCDIVKEGNSKRVIGKQIKQEDLERITF